MPTPIRAVSDVHVGSKNASVAKTPRKRSRTRKGAAFAALALITTVLLPPGTSMAATAPTLGAAESFAVLGAETVTNTGPTVVNGDLGVYAGSSITNFPPGVVNGVIHTTDTEAQLAQAAASTAYGALSAQGCESDLTGQDLGGLTLTPGVYCFDSDAQLTGTLTLNALGNPQAVFIFRVVSALDTAPGSSVVFLNSFATCNVFWQVGSSATLDTTTNFVGTVIALTSIAAKNSATVSGRLLALTAAVTLDSNVITLPVCTFALPPGTGTTTTTSTTTTSTTPVGVTTDITTDVPVGVPPVGGPGAPSLPATGSNLVPVAFAMLGIVVGGSVVAMTHKSRKTLASASKR